jgi:hypothetical protein
MRSPQLHGAGERTNRTYTEESYHAKSRPALWRAKTQSLPPAVGKDYKTVRPRQFLSYLPPQRSPGQIATKGMKCHSSTGEHTMLTRERSGNMLWVISFAARIIKHYQTYLEVGENDGARIAACLAKTGF